MDYCFIKKGLVVRKVLLTLVKPLKYICNLPQRSLQISKARHKTYIQDYRHKSLSELQY